jgi:hypothetical protein
MQKLAKEYGVSHVALSKTCRKLLVSVPGRGFWAKKAAGATLARGPPLPSLDWPNDVLKIGQGRLVMSEAETTRGPDEDFWDNTSSD